MAEDLLIIGIDSTLGSCISRMHPGKTVGTTRKKDRIKPGMPLLYLDLSEDISRFAVPAGLKSAVIFTAVTSINDCAGNSQYARFINVDQTIKLIELLSEKNIFVIFPSTNLVFSGTESYCRSDDLRDPRTDYGTHKSMVEDFILHNNIPASIIRFSKILSPDNRTVRSWISDLKKGNAIHPFSDMVLSPVPLSVACEVIYTVAERQIPGIIQVSADTDISYADMAGYIAEKMGYDPSLVQPISWKNADIDLYAVPPYTTLNTFRLTHELKIPAPDAWRTIDELIRYDKQ